MIVSWVLMTVVGCVFSLLTHELAHAVAAWTCGGQVLDFKPWPHFHNDKFYFGRCKTIWPDGRPRVSHIAPLYKNLLLLPVFMLMALAWLPLLAIGVWLVIDSVWWFVGALRGPRFDGWKYFHSEDDR